MSLITNTWETRLDQEHHGQRDLEVGAAPETLETVPVDLGAARDVEGLEAVVELAGDSVHTVLVHMLAVGQVQLLAVSVFWIRQCLDHLEVVEVPEVL